MGIGVWEYRGIGVELIKRAFEFNLTHRFTKTVS